MAMASSPKISLLHLLLLLAIFLLSSLGHCDSDEHDLLKCLNCHRAFLGLPTLSHNKEAECLATQVAQTLEKQPCSAANISTGEPFQLDRNPHLLSKCDINISHTKDGVVLPVCVHKLAPTTLVFTNFTRTHYHKYINDSKFAQAGLGCKGDWMVVVLSANTTSGDFAGSPGLIPNVGFGHCLASFLLVLLVYAQMPLAWW